MVDYSQLTSEYIESLLSHTQSLFNHVYYFTQDLSHPPGRSHRGAAVNTVDIREKREDFLRELANTACNWVYSKSRYQQILMRELERREGDAPNAASQLKAQTKRKFRKGHPQGQFGELLLFNFLQHFFHAVPLLRKMPLTTTSGVERYGADAIHYALSGSTNVLYLGEAKSYTSKYGFKRAFHESLSSILKSYDDLDNELDLYVYDDFIEEPLNDLARDFKDGCLDNIRHELVSVVAYHENNSINGDSEDIIKQEIRRTVKARYASVDGDAYDNIDERLPDRMHYVIFPIWQFDEFITKFEDSL